MRLIPSDPDVATIVGRIQNDDIDLQPEFQRGEVWGKAKKQRLIDSILRDWHVPPIHVIENSRTKRQEVLDGQQRLVAIRDFVLNKFPIDGHIEPLDQEILSLHGKLYRDLEPDWRRRFNQFSIRIFRLVEYKPSEPGELFFRLNQPTNLTSAEQRNAFFGPVREQIKQIVSELEENGLDRQFLGFSNSRMAYDDVLSRTALAIERNLLTEKITAANLADLYRQEESLRPRTVSLIRASAHMLTESKAYIAYVPRFNKATLFSWLIFLVRALLHDEIGFPNQDFAVFLDGFESAREASGRADKPRIVVGDHNIEWLLNIYDDRSTARVADVSSVLLRDAIIWTCFQAFCEASSTIAFPATLELILNAVWAQVGSSHDPDLLAKALIREGWGKLL